MRLPQLAGEPVNLCVAWEGEGEPLWYAGRGAMHEDLVAIEQLGDLRVDHGADDEDADRLVGVVPHLVRARPTLRARDHLSPLELTDPVEGAERRPSLQHDDHLLVPVVEVKRRTVTARIDLVQRCPKPFRTRLRTDAGGSPNQRRLVTLDPLGLEDIRHGAKLASDSEQPISESSDEIQSSAMNAAMLWVTVVSAASVAGRSSEISNAWSPPEISTTTASRSRAFTTASLVQASSAVPPARSRRAVVLMIASTTWWLHKSGVIQIAGK